MAWWSAQLALLCGYHLLEMCPMTSFVQQYPSRHISAQLALLHGYHLLEMCPSLLHFRLHPSSVRCETGVTRWARHTLRARPSAILFFHWYVATCFDHRGSTLASNSAGGSMGHHDASRFAVVGAHSRRHSSSSSKRVWVHLLKNSWPQRSPC